MVLGNLTNLLKMYQLTTLSYTKTNPNWIKKHTQANIEIQCKCLSDLLLLEHFLTLKIMEEITKGMTGTFYYTTIFK